MSGSIKKIQVQLVYKEPLKFHIVVLQIVTKPQIYNMLHVEQFWKSKKHCIYKSYVIYKCYAIISLLKERSYGVVGSALVIRGVPLLIAINQDFLEYSGFKSPDRS
jgi:hypothetical protein